MACTANILFHFEEPPAAFFYPLHTAVYVAATDKILGTSENYIVEHNATTGAVERTVRASTPMYGQMHLVIVNGDPWLAMNSDRSLPGDVAQPRRDIFPVDPATLSLGAALGVDSWSNSFTGGWTIGPCQMCSTGTKLYYLYPKGGSVTINYVDTANTADRTLDVQASDDWWSEQPCTNGTHVFYGQTDFERIRKRDLALGAVDSCNVAGYGPTCVEWVGGATSKPFATEVTGVLLRIDDFVVDAFTVIDLTAIQAGVLAQRLRWNSVDGLLYIPCQNQDGVIVYDPVGESGVWKSGFASPIDIVFTPTKKFAVQSSNTGLQEIT